jgi:hypothetical protein
MLGYLRVHRGQRFAATTAVAPMTEAFVADIEHTLIVLELPQVHLRDVVLALALLKGNEINAFAGHELLYLPSTGRR